jgi:hypothetical protein
VRLLILRSFVRVAMSIVVLGLLHSAAQADPLTTFTVTDLGPGMPTFATGANGGIAIAGNGQTAYPFQLAQDTTYSSTSSLAPGFPLVTSPPPTYSPGAYGDPNFVYSTVLNPIMTNGNGLYVATDASGVYGHVGTSEVYEVTKNPDGSWSTPTGLWSGGTTYSGNPDAGMSLITGINKLNEILGAGVSPTISGGALPQTYLYNANTNSLLNLSTLAVLQSSGWINVMPIAIDDQGRILLEAAPPPTSGSGPEHTLLLTPQGVSSDPLEVPAPEPSGLAIAVAAAALALRRAIQSRRQP